MGSYSVGLGISESLTGIKGYIIQPHLIWEMRCYGVAICRKWEIRVQLDYDSCVSDMFATKLLSQMRGSNIVHRLGL